ncbi:MAG: hypothetical protein ACOH2M_29165 [Cypionkella sp.]
MVLGLYGPLVCYQVMTGRRDTDSKALVGLKDVASFLEESRSGLGEIAFGSDYVGSRYGYLYRDISDEIRIFQENGTLFRPTLRDLIVKISSQKMAILVPDIVKLLDCNLFVSATIAYLNKRMVLQVFSIKNPETDSTKPSLEISVNRLAAMRDGIDIFHHLTDNSDACRKVSEKVLSRTIKRNPKLVSIAKFDWNASASVAVPKMFAEWKRECGT